MKLFNCPLLCLALVHGPKLYQILLFTHLSLLSVWSGSFESLEIESENSEGTSLVFVEDVFEDVWKLFFSDLAHKTDLILYGYGYGRQRQGSGIGNLKKYLKYQSYSYDQQQFPGSTTTHEKLLKLVSSSTDSFHTENDVIFFIQLDRLDHINGTLTQINLFYKSHPLKAFSTYFFVLWPPIMANQENSSGLPNDYHVDEGGNFPGEIRNTIKNTVPNTPLDSNLYLIFEQEQKRENHSDRETIGTNNTTSGFGFGRRGWTMWEFYNAYDKYIFQPVPLSSQEFPEFFNRRRNFQGATVKALEKKLWYLLVLKPSCRNMEQTKSEYEQVDNSLLHSISEILNIKLKIVEASGWIGQEPNGSLSGMGKQLLNHEADMSMAFSELLSYRLKELASSHPPTEFMMNVYFKYTPPGLQRDILIEAFKPDLWALMFVTWATIVICAIVFSEIKTRVLLENCSESDKMFGRDAACWAVSAACITSWNCTPTSNSLQFIFVSGFMTGFICYTAYSASIIAIFSVERDHLQSLSDLLAQGYKLYGDNEHSITGQYHVKEQAKADNVTVNSRLTDVVSALDKIQKSQVAYIISRENLFSKAGEQKVSYSVMCEYLTKLPRPVDRLYNVWFFRKFDPLRKFINLQLTRSRELGLLSRMNVDLGRTIPAPCDPHKKDTMSLEIQDVRTAFFIIMAGLILCLCVLALELMFWSREKMKESFLVLEN